MANTIRDSEMETWREHLLRHQDAVTNDLLSPAGYDPKAAMRSMLIAVEIIQSKDPNMENLVERKIPRITDIFD